MVRFASFLSLFLFFSLQCWFVSAMTHLRRFEANKNLLPCQWIIFAMAINIYIYFFMKIISNDFQLLFQIIIMGARLSRSDFQWVYTDEPHTTRRREMLRKSTHLDDHHQNTHEKKNTISLLFLEKYPQIKQLMGHDWRIAVQVVITVLIQLTMAYFVRDLPWNFVWLLTYVISGTLNHSLSISFHESKNRWINQSIEDIMTINLILVGHNLAFGNHRPMANRILGFIANLPLCIPSSVTFKKYHIDHHKSVDIAPFLVR